MTTYHRNTTDRSEGTLIFLACILAIVLAANVSRLIA